MNRKIAFRTWDGKKMREEMGLYGATLNKGLAMIEEQGDVLMQFTGLLDKNGKEIYEGDVAEVEDGPSKKAREIIWDKTGGCFALTLLNRSTEYLPNYVRYEQIEIIGNIYENPELIGKL